MRRQNSVRLVGGQDWDHVLQSIYEGTDAEDLQALAEIVQTTDGRPSNKSRRNVAVQGTAAARGF